MHQLAFGLTPLRSRLWRDVLPLKGGAEGRCKSGVENDQCGEADQGPTFSSGSSSAEWALSWP
jgi:hypothetical protein